MAIDVREVVASVRSLLGGGAAFIIGNSLLGIALPLRMEAATLHTTQSRSGSSPVRSRPRIAIASARPAEVVRSGDDCRPGASLTPAPMRPPVPMPVSIYRPAGSAVQSGRANTKRWVLEFEPTSPPEIEPLMGWLASMDTQKQVRLMFPTRGSAVAFADRHGWDYTVYEPRERTVSPKSYAEQFTRGITKAAA